MILSGQAAAIEIRSLRIIDIEIGDRTGFLRESAVAALRGNMAIEGQLSPILVQRHGANASPAWTLIKGRRRLRAAQLLGWAEIAAIEAAGPTADASRLLRLEIDATIQQRHLRPIEQSRFAHVLVRIEEEIDHPGHVGETRLERATRLRHPPRAMMALGADQVGNSDCTAPTAIMAQGENYQERAARQLDVSVRTLKRLGSIHRHIVVPFPDLAERLDEHQIGENLTALERLTQLSEADRRVVIETIIADPDLQTVEAAITRSGKGTSRGNRGDDRLLNIITHLKKPERLHYGKELIRYATPDVRRQLAIAGIARSPGHRADFIAAAMAGLSHEEQLALLSDASARKIDLSEFDDQPVSGKRG